MAAIGDFPIPLKLSHVFPADGDGEQFRLQKELPLGQRPVAEEFLRQIKVNVGGEDAYRNLVNRVAFRFSGHDPLVGFIFFPRGGG